MLHHTLVDLPDLRVETPRFIADMSAPARSHTTPLLVVGGGLAGLSAALRAAEHCDVTLLARMPLSESNSAWAQGGIAAALAPEDAPRLHVADTLVAGAGLCDEAAVELLAEAAPALMVELARLGVPFAREGDGFALGMEGGHSQRRILHVEDATGWAVTRVLAQRAWEHPRIHIFDELQVVDLLGAGVCTGVLARDRAGGWHRFYAEATILATGGAGALFGLSSNPPAALGEGIAMAYRAGAEVADMELVQFHPTVFRTSNGQGFLITEAARGEGGRLLTPHGRRFMPAFDPRAELAPRDVVTRGIYGAMAAEGCDHVLLDLTHLGAAFIERRFPTIVARLREEGIDPTSQPIPVAPAAHYLMGGISTDLDGATSLPGLYAAGECACTGVHGANRLASNSLLECLVFGRRAAEAITEARGEDRGPRTEDRGPRTENREPRTENREPRTEDRRIETRDMRGGTIPFLNSQFSILNSHMTAHVGPVRDGAGLALARAQLAGLAPALPATDGGQLTAANALLAARLIVAGALLRRESRGGHFRRDFPTSDEGWRGHIVQAVGQAPALVEEIGNTRTSLAH